MTVTAVQKDILLPALQRLLGHDRLTTTEVYLNPSAEEVLREFREKWGYVQDTCLCRVRHKHVSRTYP